MARLISSATGNWTAAGTWALVDATSLLDSEAANTALTTSYVTSTTFTPGAITIDGIAVKLASVSASPTGTISVALDLSGATVAGTEVTLNVSDLPTMVTGTTTNEGGWVLFKFAGTVTLAAATAYGVKGKTSSATQVNLYSLATTNWSRLLRTTTNQAPVAGDVMHIIGEHTGATTGNDFTVTMNETATTDYGPGTDSTVALTIGKRGTLTYGTTATTNYYLKLSGNLIVYNGGVLNVGTVGAEIPRDSTAVLEFDPVADGGMGLTVRNGGTYVSQGLSRTSGKNIISCQLTSTITATATTLNVDTDTGWLNGDLIEIAKTTVSTSRADEQRTLSGAAGATSFSITSGVANTHHGVSPYQAHVVLITRNVTVRSATSTIMAYFNCKATSTVDIDWTWFRYMGSAGVVGLSIETTTGSFNMNYSSFSESEQRGMAINNSCNNVSIVNNVLANHNTANPTNQSVLVFGTSLGASITFTDNFIIGCTHSGGGSLQDGIIFNYNTINFSRNVLNSWQNGMTIAFNSNTALGTFDDNVIYGCGGSGFGAIYQRSAIPSGTINRLKAWHNNGSFFAVTSSISNLNFIDCDFYGNSTSHINFSSGGSGINLIFTTCDFNGDSVATTTSGVTVSSGSVAAKILFNNCNFGIASGQYTAHTNDVLTNGGYSDILFNNCNFGSTTLLSGQSSADASSIFKFHKYNQVENNHLWYTKYGIARSTGTGLTDTNIRTTGSLNVRIAPIDSTTGFTWSFKIPAVANTTVSFQGFFEKNAAFGTDVATISLFLPGSTTADATSTLSNTTGSYLSAAVSAYFSSTVDGLATVTINAKTTTSAAYLYCADFYNSGDTTTLYDKLAGLTVWNEGKPAEIITQINLGGVPSAVWAVATSGLTGAGTIGNRLKKALTVPLFLGLK